MVQPGFDSDVRWTERGAGCTGYGGRRICHQWNYSHVNLGNEKCPDHGPDASPRELADNHALAAGAHVLGTTATVRGARGVSSGVVPVIIAEGFRRGAEVEAEVTEGA